MFKRSPKGNTIITKRPDVSNVRWSKAQKAHRKRIAASNEYVKAAMADPVVRAIYEKRGTKAKRVPDRVAVSDYYKGKNLLSKKPCQAQKAHWDRFTEAANYAIAALADPDLCAYYEAEAARCAQNLQPRNVAMADYLNGKSLFSK